MAIRKIKNKVQNSRAALQSKFNEVGELRSTYQNLVLSRLRGNELLEDELVAAQEAAQRHNAAADALDKERDRLDGVFAARLQQARNEIAQLTGQVDTLVVRCRRLELDKENAEASVERAEDKARTISYCAYGLGAIAIIQDAYYTQWYVTAFEFVKGLL